VKYVFRWRERAVRQLRAIPQPAALTILQALTPLGDDPRRPDANVKKLAGYEDRYRLRVGDYRVIYDVTDKQLVILVVGVGHRREIYRAIPDGAT
jgi:mRNA interferase RelE/StbE